MLPKGESERKLEQYGRGHWFHHLGSDIILGFPADYLCTLFHHPIAPASGAATDGRDLRWTDQVLSDYDLQGLAHDSPDFIRRHPSEERFYPDEAIGETVRLGATGPDSQLRALSVVREAAADPAWVEAEFVKSPGDTLSPMHMRSNRQGCRW